MAPPSTPFLSHLYLSFSLTTHIQSGSKPPILRPSTQQWAHPWMATLAWPPSPDSEYCVTCPLGVGPLLRTSASMIISNVNPLPQHLLWFLSNYPTISLRIKVWHSSHGLGGAKWPVLVPFSRVTPYPVALAHSCLIWWIAILQRPPAASHIRGVTCFLSPELRLPELPSLCFLVSNSNTASAQSLSWPPPVLGSTHVPSVPTIGYFIWWITLSISGSGITVCLCFSPTQVGAHDISVGFTESICNLK